MLPQCDPFHLSRRAVICGPPVSRIRCSWDALKPACWAARLRRPVFDSEARASLPKASPVPTTPFKLRRCG
jgi:hypothetical protein